MHFTIYYTIPGSEPRFLSTMVNASVTVGRDAALTCHISHSEGYKVTKDSLAKNNVTYIPRGNIHVCIIMYLRLRGCGWTPRPC